MDFIALAQKSFQTMRDICFFISQRKHMLWVLIRSTGIYLEFWWMGFWPIHQKFQGPLTSRGSGDHRPPVGSRGNAPVRGPGVQTPLGSKLILSIFYVLRQHLLECFFYNNKLAFSLSEKKKKKCWKFTCLTNYSENTGLGESMDDRALLCLTHLVSHLLIYQGS